MQNEADGATPHDNIHENMASLNAKSSANAAVSAPANEEEGEHDILALALEMQQRCTFLLDELEQFQVYVKDQGSEHDVELKVFKRGLQSEKRIIDKIAKDPSKVKNIHAWCALNSSNLSFFSALWSTAKTCSGVTGMLRRFYWLPGQTTAYINGMVNSAGLEHRKHSTLVDIVCLEGLEWVKVSSIRENRIIMDLAKAGWVGSDSSEAEEEDDNGNEPQGLSKQVEELVKAARSTRVKYRHPTVRLVLTRISSTPKIKEVAQILQQIRDMGVTVQTSETVPEPTPIAEVLHQLAVDRSKSVSDVLNIDCTILLAFVSDLSHGRVEPQDWHHQMINRQRELESKEPFLLNELWPACGSRKLVCTSTAFESLQRIIGILATKTEKRRAALLLGLDDCANLSADQLREEFQSLSEHSIPADWSLPIEVVDVDLAALRSRLPPAFNKLSESLPEINQSVFFYGWESGRTTLSSNRVAAKQIESSIEENRTSDEDRGPDVWLFQSRSLVGKEKKRRGA
ncbi:UPF0415 protein [Lachnellula suecica]|uniref:UPF0415 protein n=1 Tax=Lachnellula suecica TaxID=602035 RepID=A0A8T9BY16_9HELO|nr:UPF0415 protein [Lachnellula suecica]